MVRFTAAPPVTFTNYGTVPFITTFTTTYVTTLTRTRRDQTEIETDGRPTISNNTLDTLFSCAGTRIRYSQSSPIPYHFPLPRSLNREYKSDDKRAVLQVPFYFNYSSVKFSKYTNYKHTHTSTHIPHCQCCTSESGAQE
jgi:hypothetical protein